MGSWRTDVDIDNYDKAEEFLGDKDKRRYPVGKVTFIERLSPTRIGVRYQKTIIVEYEAISGTITLNSGGWFTITTKAKINEFTPRSIRVYSHLGKWYVSVGVLEGGTTYDFTNGMRIYPSNRVVGALESDQEMDQREYRRGRRFMGRRLIPMGEPNDTWQGSCHVCGGDNQTICTRCGRGVPARRASYHEHVDMSSELNHREVGEVPVHHRVMSAEEQMRAEIQRDLNNRDAQWRQAQMRQITNDPEAEGKVYVPEFAKGNGKA